MFGLPLETFLLVFGFPLLWIVYTVVFMHRSRNWDDETADRDDAS
jgi:hypothetical protein